MQDHTLPFINPLPHLLPMQHHEHFASESKQASASIDGLITSRARTCSSASPSSCCQPRMRFRRPELSLFCLLQGWMRWSSCWLLGQRSL